MTRLPFAARLLIATAIAAVVVIAAQSAAPGLYGYDGYFHIRYGEWIRSHGVGGPFPWWQETFLREQAADKEILFHLLLVPFTFGDLEAGGKTASIVFATGLFVALFLALERLETRLAAGWMAACAVSSATLLYRAGLLRAVVPAVAIALIGTAAILKERRAWTGVASGAYALTHIAWQLLPGIALIHDIVVGLRRRRPVWSATAAALAGTLAGVILSPYFPANLKLWYVQNVSVPALSWSGAGQDLGLGSEYLPGRPLDLLRDDPGPWLFTAVGLAAVLVAARRRERKPSTPAVTLGVVTLGCLALSLLSRRFVEIWAPFSALFAAVAVSDRQPWSRTARRVAVAAGVVAFALLGVSTLSRTRSIVAQDPGRVFDVCASWIRDHVPDDETVFTTDWDEFPELFYVAPRQRYLVGMDPTFMYATSPDRWKLWRDIVEGRAADIAGPIRDVFNCRVVFADTGEGTFVERADQDPMLRPVAGGPDCTVYTLRDPDPAGPWGDAPVVTWSLEGGGEPMVAAPRDFVDVGAAAERAGIHGDCARLRGRFASAGAGRATFAVSTDDTVSVDVDGRPVFDSRAAAPPTLDEAVAAAEAGGLRRHVRSFEADVAAGYTDLLISTCRTGRVWGFHFGRASRP